MSLAHVYPLLLPRPSYSCLVLPRVSSCIRGAYDHRKRPAHTHQQFSSAAFANPNGTLLTSNRFTQHVIRTLSASASACGSSHDHELPESLQENAEHLDLIQLAGKHRKKYTNIYVWGFTFTGALGVPSYFFPSKRKHDIRKPKKFQSTPYKLKFEEKITSVACGYGFTLMSSNTEEPEKVWGMGINTNSQLGFQPKTHESVEGMHTVVSPAPIDLPLTRPRKTRVTQVACGRGHSLVLTDEEGVFSLGNNSNGQCGRPIIPEEDYSSNQVIHSIKGIKGKVKQISCGQDHSLFLTDEGHVYSCGNSADGQTGLGHSTDTSTPTRLEGDIKDEYITQITTSADCCLAISNKGEVFGWGNSEYNQLKCVSEETQVYEPRHLPFTEVGKVTSAATGGTICALTNDVGEVWVWGYGFLGMGPKLTDTTMPTCIDMNLFGRSAGKSDVTVHKVWCGLHYFAAITNKGDLYTWGTNGSGCLGLGMLHSQFFPLKVSLPGQVVDMGCGVDHTIALVQKEI